MGNRNRCIILNSSENPSKNREALRHIFFNIYLQKMLFATKKVNFAGKIFGISRGKNDRGEVSHCASPTNSIRFPRFYVFRVFLLYRVEPNICCNILKLLDDCPIFSLLSRTESEWLRPCGSPVFQCF